VLSPTRPDGAFVQRLIDRLLEFVTLGEYRFAACANAGDAPHCSTRTTLAANGRSRSNQSRAPVAPDSWTPGPSDAYALGLPATYTAGPPDSCTRGLALDPALAFSARAGANRDGWGSARSSSHLGPATVAARRAHRQGQRPVPRATVTSPTVRIVGPGAAQRRCRHGAPAASPQPCLCSGSSQQSGGSQHSGGSQRPATGRGCAEARPETRESAGDPCRR